MPVVGQSILRVDAASKADGSLQYTDDLEFNGLYGDIVRSSIAYGKIASITFDEKFDFSEFVVVDYRDIEGKNSNTVLIDDQPFLAQDYVRFIGEPILLLAHQSKEALREAKKYIHIEYMTKEPILTMEDSLNKKSIIFGDDNIYKTIQTTKGKEPDYTKLKSLQKQYTTPHQEQLYLEPQSMMARHNSGIISIIGSMQCPFYVSAALEDLTNQKIEVEQAPTGGAFGGKEDYPSLMAAYVYLLSKKASEDVKIIYSRTDDIAYTTKRHPAKMEFKSYFDESGKLHALDINVVIDGGAYCTLTPVVLARTVLHIAGFYDCEYIKVNGYAVATNTPPNGAFRGFGAPQAIFGIERHMDDIARSLGISPMIVREINLPTPNSISVTGVKIDEYKNLQTIFELTRQKSDFDRKYATRTPYKGIGMALFMHGGGFTGIGEVLLASEVWLVLHDDGHVEIKIGSTEMGQGTLTVLPQIVADVLNIPISMIEYHVPNTAKVANSGPTVASRTVMIVGELLSQAAKKLKQTIGKYNNHSEYLQAVTVYTSLKSKNIFTARYKKPDNIRWDEEHFYGNGYDGYSLACYVAEVEIDPVDYRINVTGFYAFNDVGKVVNPVLAEGQVEGGVAQGIGYALYERITHKDGKIRSSRLSDYTIPMAADLVKFHVDFLNTQNKSKGLGELPMNGAAPAIANAISHALGIECDSIPITPEVLEQKCR